MSKNWEEMEKEEEAEWERLEQERLAAEKFRARIQIFTLIGIFVLAIIWWVISSDMEAKTYTKLTGKQVTTWDAMWVDLRIQDGAK